MRNFCLIAIIACCGIILACSKTQDTSIVGIWQDMPMAASGWSDTYQFFANGKFIFHYSQMDEEKRINTYSGTWMLLNDKLILTISEINCNFDGKEINRGNESHPVYSLTETKNISLETKPVKLSYSITPKELDLSSPKDIQKMMILLGGKKYWQWDTDANKYN